MKGFKGVVYISFPFPKLSLAQLDMPEFSGLLAEKPTSIFMTETDYSAIVASKIQQAGGVYELRTYTCNEGKLAPLNARFRDFTTELFGKHGMKNIGYWTPFDPPESQNTMIYLIHHKSREQADANWKSFRNDPAWQSVAKESQQGGKILAKSPDRIFLRPLDFSPLK